MTSILFQPNDNAAPPFQTPVTLDGSSYNLQTQWNIAGQRWYYSLTDQAGNLVVNEPLIGSPPDYDLPLAYGIFVTSVIVFRQATSTFEVTP